MNQHNSITLQPGTLVVCKYRMPSVLQPWIHEIPIGVVLEPDTDPSLWNGSNSERQYCESCHKTKVSYDNGRFTQHDATDSLIPITPEQSALSFRDKIGAFLGSGALANYDKAMGIRPAVTA